MVRFRNVDGPLWQWDTGRKIAIFSDTPLKVNEVHFSSPDNNSALVVLPELSGSEYIAGIPDILLENDGAIEVYAVVYTQDGERTYAKYSTAIRQRQKPDDYVCSEAETMNYSTLNKRIDELMESTAQEIQTSVSSQLALAKESGEFDGKDGTDGISATHSWNGTVLTVTSASGTSFADLKGDKGDTGAQGPQGEKGDTGADGKDGINGTNGVDGKDGKDGEKGADGYTPIKGVDYYTEADKSEFSEYIASELAKRGQLKPEFANDISECTDTTKMYVLPDGYIYAYMLTEVESGPAYTNQLPLAIDSNGTVYNGTGYKNGYRINSSSVEKEASGCGHTGFIPTPENAVIRFKNISACTSGYDYIHFYGSDFIQCCSPIQTFAGGLTDEGNGVTSITIPNNRTGFSYIRASYGTMSADSIITINEEIKEGVGTTTAYAWVNTGHAFVPTDYEDRIVSLEEQTAATTEEIENLKNNGVSAKDTSLMFISPDGDDSNDGLTAYTPKKTVKACVNAGAKRISAKRGVYKQYIQMWDIDELEIFPTDNDLTYAVGEEREPIIFDTSDSIAVSSFATYNSIKRVAYSNSANTQFDKVFTKQSLTPVVGDGYGSRYNSTIWLLSDDEKSVCIKLKPVLTVAECEAETNTFTYVDGYIYINANMTSVTKVIVPTNWDCGLYFNGFSKVILKEVEVRFSGSYNIDLRNCAYFELYKCACKYTSFGSGFHPINSNGTMTACYATKNYDGYGISGYGHTTYIDCVSEFNFDDGMSHHNGTSGTVIGGRYEGNGKGGNTPAYGAKVNIYGGIYKDNASFGIGYLYYSAEGAASGIVQGAVMDGNPIGLAVNANCPVTVISPVFKNNTTDKEYNGIVTEY